MMSNTTEKMKVVFRAEMALLRAEAKRAQHHVVFMALTISCILLVVVAFNIGLYFHFTGMIDARNAAFLIVGVNLFIAMIPLFLASRIKPSNEEAMLIEIRDKTADSLTKPVNNLFESTSSLSTFSPLLGVVLKSFTKTKS